MWKTSFRMQNDRISKTASFEEKILSKKNIVIKEVDKCILLTDINI